MYLYCNVCHVPMVKHPALALLSAGGAQGQGHLLRLRGVDQQVLVQVALWHVLKDKALRLVLQDDPKQADDVGVPQVCHQFRVALEIASRRLVGSDLEGLDGDESAAAPHNPSKLPSVDLAKHTVAHLLNKADRRDGKLSRSNLRQLGHCLIGEEGVHLHLGVVVSRPRAWVDEAPRAAGRHAERLLVAGPEAADGEEHGD